LHFSRRRKKKVKFLVYFVFSGFTSDVPKYVDTFRAETQADKSPTANTGAEKRYGNLQRKKDLILFGCQLETVFVIFLLICQECVGKEVIECLQQFPVQIRGKRAPIKPDEVQPNESDTLKLLPPPLLPHKISPDSPLPPLVDSISSNLEHLASDVAAAPAPVGHTRVANNLLDGSIQELDLFALNELSISCSSSEREPNNLMENTDDDPFSSLSLTVQGRIIPCIPCENISPTGQQLPPPPPN
jgi:hypothetical protein